MRLWSIHPGYLDCKGLLGLWRESLLAKKVLQGKTNRYKSHPQLIRFKNQKYPVKAIDTYLHHVYEESLKRGYKFDKRKLEKKSKIKITVNDRQMKYEFSRLKKKLKKRSPDKYKELMKTKKIKPHPLFIVKKGPIESWEKLK
ncbi:pyrimidine dimer DNA glycosylase/endonuclease V [Candidatus Woesearchaeota archaeon]|nr:pyrimidine dimer DNA glycosylase/endonuclease V [Candidatus Woesearchaeota archaeon]